MRLVALILFAATGTAVWVLAAVWGPDPDAAATPAVPETASRAAPGGGHSATPDPTPSSAPPELQPGAARIARPTPPRERLEARAARTRSILEHHPVLRGKRWTNRLDPPLYIYEQLGDGGAKPRRTWFVAEALRLLRAQHRFLDGSIGGAVAGDDPVAVLYPVVVAEPDTALQLLRRSAGHPREVELAVEQAKDTGFGAQHQPDFLLLWEPATRIHAPHTAYEWREAVPWVALSSSGLLVQRYFEAATASPLARRFNWLQSGLAATLSAAKAAQGRNEAWTYAMGGRPPDASLKTIWTWKTGTQHHKQWAQGYEGTQTTYEKDDAYMQWVHALTQWPTLELDIAEVLVSDGRNYSRTLLRERCPSHRVYKSVLDEGFGLEGAMAAAFVAFCREPDRGRTWRALCDYIRWQCGHGAELPPRPDAPDRAVRCRAALARCFRGVDLTRLNGEFWAWIEEHH